MNKNMELVERERKNIDKLYHNFINDFPYIFNITSVKNTIIIDVNKEWTNILGYSIEDTLG